MKTRITELEQHKVNQEDMINELRSALNEREDSHEQIQFKLKEDFEVRINEYEDSLNKKIIENSRMLNEIGALKSQIEKLELDVGKF